MYILGSPSYGIPNRLIELVLRMPCNGMVFASGLFLGLLSAFIVLAQVLMRVTRVEVPQSGKMQKKVEDQESIIIPSFEPRYIDQGPMVQCSNPLQTWKPVWFEDSTYCANVRQPGTDPDCFLVHTLVSKRDTPYRVCDHSRPFGNDTFLLGIGPPKTSSTVLFKALGKFVRFLRLQNPNRCCNMEYHFWSQDAKFTAGLQVYRTYWQPNGPGVFYEKTPEYFYNPLVAYRVVQLVPHAKLLVTLRSWVPVKELKLSHPDTGTWQTLAFPCYYNLL